MDIALTSLDRTKHRVAILVDGDNFPHSKVADVESRAAQWGEVTVRRVFGDMALHKDWGSQTVYTAMHSTTTAGKNRADMALVVAGMDMAHRGLASAFVIVSDDRDFGPLVYHLREQGFRVEWLGKADKTAGTKAAVKPTATRACPLVEKVKIIVADAGKEGFPIHMLGPAGQKVGIKISETPQKTWRAWLLAHDAVFVCDPRGPAARVRLKS